MTNKGYIRIITFKQIQEVCPKSRMSCYGCPKEEECPIPKKEIGE